VGRNARVFWVSVRSAEEASGWSMVELGNQSSVAANYCIDQTENETNRQQKFQRQKNLIRTVDAITTLFLHEWSSGIA
jgi:hypothetical protein